MTNDSFHMTHSGIYCILLPLSLPSHCVLSDELLRQPTLVCELHQLKLHGQPFHQMSVHGRGQGHVGDVSGCQGHRVYRHGGA